MNGQVISNTITNLTTNIPTSTTNILIQTIGTPGLEYWIWASIGTLFFVLELFIPGFIFFWFGLSAIFVSVLTLFLIKTLELQIIVWLGLSITLIISYFYLKKKKYSDNKESQDPIFNYVGIKGDVIQSIVGSKIGKVRLDVPINGISDWNAISQNPDETIEVGSRVEVVGIEGIKLIVRKI
ncbi:MAG: NfeD family protein [Brevinematales bacterium]|nr:NfeD family protein [Brevinematales bacterium]